MRAGRDRAQRLTGEAGQRWFVSGSRAHVKPNVSGRWVMRDNHREQPLSDHLTATRSIAVRRS